ncbi:uncharacterized protein DFL_007851 [Arthrobotrys flagrans]|uniref:F-box domain-containing protein n=1 Tax=Arthrobotrys flagrans TaxID=97331 RepID=A0A436ZXK6_ARTFL|nr:hypothetical protein DFL_007851 [Arthrobotrys flagrans]
MPSLTTLPQEILMAIALNLPKPQDVKHLSSTCQILRRALGISNQLLWWNIWRKIYWMPDTSANGFCETVDYWKRVMDVLVPPDQRDPLACFNCYVQATTCPIHPIYYGDKFYRGLCLMCLGKKFWIVDELPREYLDIVIPPEMHATTTPQIYEMMQYMGFLSSGKNPNIWVRKADAIAYAKTILPPEETSEKGVLCIGIFSLTGLPSRSWRRCLRNDQQDGGEARNGGPYEDKLDSHFMLRFSDPLLVNYIPIATTLSIHIIYFSAKKYEEHIISGMSISDLSALYRNILTQYFGPPCGSKHKFSLKLVSHPYDCLLMSWVHSFFLDQYTVKMDRFLIHSLENRFFKCPFCGTFLRHPEVEELDRKDGMVYLCKKEEMLVIHILEEHHEEFEDSWVGKYVAPPDVYEDLESGEMAKVDCVLSTWKEGSASSTWDYTN